ncbi:MAG TPA: serine hydrolase domain-containing protein [Bryobacteraceae bacterium]
MTLAKALAALLCACAPAAAAGQELDALFAPLAGERSPGLAVLVRKNGRTVFERGYGVRDLRTFAAIGANTNFRLASCTKQFTAMAVMLLVHEGKLRYEQRLPDIFPDFPAYGRAITVRHLLTHTSGLPDYENLMDAQQPAWTPERQIRDGEVLELLKAQTRGKFAPGTNWAYSNSGYVVLGLIVARVSAEPFGEFLRHRIFEPLHMRATLAYVSGRNTVPHRAYGHALRTGRLEEADQSATSATLGDGGVYSNLSDLARWDEALRQHTLLSEAEMRAALRPAQLADGSAARWPAAPGDDNLDPGKPVSYGFGWFLDTYHGRARMWHFGSTSGFRTAIERFPREGLTVVILCNRTDLDAAGLALRAADIARGVARTS